MSKLINWFRSFSKEKNLKEEIICKIELYQKQTAEVNKKRNLFLANGVPEKEIAYLDFPEPMRILTLKNPVYNSLDFANALSIFLEDIDKEKFYNIELRGFEYSIFRCEYGSREIYCDAGLKF